MNVYLYNSQSSPNVIVLWTFLAPKVGNWKWQQTFLQKMKNNLLNWYSIRYTYSNVHFCDPKNSIIHHFSGFRLLSCAKVLCKDPPQIKLFLGYEHCLLKNLSNTLIWWYSTHKFHKSNVKLRIPKLHILQWWKCRNKRWLRWWFQKWCWKVPLILRSTILLTLHIRISGLKIPLQYRNLLLWNKEISWGGEFRGILLITKKNVSIVFLILTNQTKKVKDLIIGNS